MTLEKAERIMADRSTKRIKEAYRWLLAPNQFENFVLVIRSRVRLAGLDEGRQGNSAGCPFVDDCNSSSSEPIAAQAENKNGREQSRTQNINHLCLDLGEPPSYGNRRQAHLSTISNVEADPGREANDW